MLPSGTKAIRRVCGCFDHILLVECKNWTTSTGYPELAVFNDKLTSRGRPMGIFVAAAGITATGLTAAHEVLARALAQGREIMVLTRREIENLEDTDDPVLAGEAYGGCAHDLAEMSREQAGQIGAERAARFWPPEAVRLPWVAPAYPM